jgi:hypothetical protein
MLSHALTGRAPGIAGAPVPVAAPLLRSLT